MKRPTGRVRVSVIAGLLAAASLSAGTAQAQSAIFNVTTTEDIYDGSCDDHCSMRDAVYSANALGGAGTVFAPAGTYDLGSGPLVITSTMTIEGVGGTATLDAEYNNRVVEVKDTGDVTLKNLLVTRGKVTDGGGGILNYGTVTIADTIVNASSSSITCGGGFLNIGMAFITRSNVAQNTAPLGAGICNGPTATMNIFNSDVPFNIASDRGGGIYNQGNMDLQEVVLGTNNAQNDGGGIFNEGSLSMADTWLIQNETTDGNGGGLYNLDTAEITTTGVVENVAGSGAGIYNSGTAQLINTTVRKNVAEVNGGGILSDDWIDISYSTVSENSALDGAGIMNTLTAYVTNSTISGNSAIRHAGGIYQGGNNSVTITSSTMIGNASDADHDGDGDGGGIGINTGTASIGNSIVANNADGGIPNHPDCSGPLLSVGYNIISSLSGCQIALETTDSTDPLAFMTLASNGGPTDTHALPPDSIGVGHGPTGSACAGMDQRGVPRHSPCDTGAYQVAFCGKAVINVVGTGQKDLLKGTKSSDGILAKGGRDYVRAGGGDDYVCGGGGDDRLLGRNGNDHLFGANDNDLLKGGPGTDECVGGPGKNRYQSC